MRFERTDDLLQDTKFLKGTAASPNSHIMSGLAAAGTKTEPLHPIAILQGAEGLQNVMCSLYSPEEGRSLRPKGYILQFHARRKKYVSQPSMRWFVPTSKEAFVNTEFVLFKY